MSKWTLAASLLLVAIAGETMPGFPVDANTAVAAAPAAPSSRTPFEQDRVEPQPDSGRARVASGMMMGRGMMGGGMMSGEEPSASEPEDNRDAGQGAAAPDRLVGYIQRQGLTCLACHAVSGRRAGPPFDAIAERYEGQNGAAARLAHSVTDGAAGRWAGYSPMPAGQASPAQADELARLILELNGNR